MEYEAILYSKLKDKRVQCNICQRRCIIQDGKLGWCNTRENRRGRLYTLIYGLVSTMAVSPIEKKPVFHFYPGSMWLSLGSLGCNFRCPGCQNWEIAHAHPTKSKKGSGTFWENIGQTEYLSPQEAVKLAKRNRCMGISWTYNEPTIWFEYTLNSAKLAKKESLYTNYVTNGFITPEALNEIGPYLDVFRVDLKGFSNDYYNRLCRVPNFKGILDVVKMARSKWKMHVEVVTNLVPGYNDSSEQLRQMARWIHSQLGPDTPWHLTGFFPHLGLSNLPPTEVSTLEGARQIGLEEELHYVYLGNVPGHPGENTYCFKCKALLVQRDGFTVTQNRIESGKCPVCNASVPGKFTGSYHHSRQILSSVKVLFQLA